ncbi:hypothetical protein SMB34_11175 [Thalassospira permensis NBRC 106175]|uniref:DUF3298 domain-containing protein n=1 Tax=Thalassospira permensis NBRC 106175 TaxID=1353532 RepID=A0ABR4TT73_9PROT|nr:hypothetical protein SMB34_11175 [Thalassospira permensis NBRC 106175]
MYFHFNAESDGAVFGPAGRIAELARGAIVKFFEK